MVVWVRVWSWVRHHNYESLQQVRNVSRCVKTLWSDSFCKWRLDHSLGSWRLMGNCLTVGFKHQRGGISMLLALRPGWTVVTISPYIYFCLSWRDDMDFFNVIDSSDMTTLDTGSWIHLKIFPVHLWVELSLSPLDIEGLNSLLIWFWFLSKSYLYLVWFFSNTDEVKGI